MTAPAPPPVPLPPSARPALWHPVLVTVMALCTGIEAVLLLADYGVIGSPRWRPLAYQYGAFWAGLLHGWKPNFAAQPATMFLTHAFLHAGPMHLIGNMLALAVLGQILLERHGPSQHGPGQHGAWRFALVYLAAILGGGAAFGLLTRSAVPMVGASGAIFGLAGAGLIWRWQDQGAAGLGQLRRLTELCGGLVGLIAINVVMWWSQDGLLAWQTHLGGTLAGMVVAALWPAQRPILAKMRS